MFSHFPAGTLPFLAELQRNNTKAWFDANKMLYHELVLEPSRAFVEEMGEHLMALVPTINAVPKVNGSLFRIYRDQRFHFDEPPLKDHIGIVFWQGSGKRMQSSAFYLHFDPRTLFVATGLRRFKPAMLSAYRAYLKSETRRRELQQILDGLTEKGYRLPEKRYKRFPPGFDKQIPFAELALYDSLYAYTETDAALITSDKLLDTLYAHYEAMLPLQQWVYELTLYAAENG
ncbi:DUF2461 domain-containing protein [Sulfurimonas sp. HSL1-2]|uniref:DUF2461 domain-containing protein n=1 Tax=Thiomicrolovo zhangzhouensis TaxID=3131933 RepID=UPI0031F8DECA